MKKRNRITGIILTALCLLAGGGISAEAAVLGDVSRDGVFNISDPQLALQLYAETVLTGSSEPEPDVFYAADIDCSGTVSAADAQILLRCCTERLTGNPVTWEELIPELHSLPLTREAAEDALFGEHYIRAARDVSRMTDAEKVSQLFLVSFGDDAAMQTEVSSESCPAGYILFAADFINETPVSIAEKLDALQAESRYGLLLGCDEEGGAIVRASGFPQYRDRAFPTPQALFASGGLQAVFDDAKEKALFLRGLSMNYNLAPVVDMPEDPASYIFDRTLGQDAETTAAYAAGVVKVMNEQNMLATLKHFPGYGDNLDTHSLVSRDLRTKEQFMTRDLLPFISGIEAGVPMIMVNHNIITCLDDEKPASLSAPVHQLLRDELHYSGLIVTDALTMGAVMQYTDDRTAAVQAILCGNDLIAIGRSADYPALRDEVLSAVQNGTISETTLNDAVRRVLACKYAYGIRKLPSA